MIGLPVGKGFHRAFLLTLTQAQRDFFDAVESLPNHPTHRFEKVIVQCRCGMVYSVPYKAAYQSESTTGTGNTRQYTAHVERWQKRVPCPSCGRKDGFAIGFGEPEEGMGAG